MRRPAALLAAASTAVALLAGCGSSSKSGSNNSSASTAASASTQTTASAPAPSTPATTTAAASSTVGVLSKPSKYGAILAAGPKRLTVYMFEADKGATSACEGACAQAGPPVSTAGAAVASGGAMSADLGTITRADGTKQVTYNGHPLYFFARDGDAGDAYGEGVNAFGAGWYVLKPNGAKVDKS